MSKKATSFLLALLMVCSLAVPALAEEPAQDDYSTTVSYTGKSTEHYTLTVPQSLKPGEEGQVKLEGEWSTDRSVIVTADETVSMSDNASTPIVLDVNFDGINRVGDNEQAITETKAISVAEMNALFGTWQGTFNYNVSIDDTEDAKWRDAVEFTLSSKNRAAIGYTGEENEELVIPAHFIGDGNNGTVEGQKYKTTISTMAFQKCTNLKSVTISEGITTVGEYAFYSCKNLTSVTLPSTLTSIGDRAFDTCNNLTDITLPDGLSSIGYRAFAFCKSLTTINIPSTVTSIGEEAFASSSSLTDVTIPDGITSLPNKLFFYCYDLTSVTIPKSVTSIGSSVFETCTSLKDVNYCGTRAEWNAITKGDNWDYTSGSGMTVHCTDDNN